MEEVTGLPLYRHVKKKKFKLLKTLKQNWRLQEWQTITKEQSFLRSGLLLQLSVNVYAWQLTAFQLHIIMKDEKWRRKTAMKHHRTLNPIDNGACSKYDNIAIKSCERERERERPEKPVRQRTWTPISPRISLACAYTTLAFSSLLFFYHPSPSQSRWNHLHHCHKPSNCHIWYGNMPKPHREREREREREHGY
jgi:hypothetical protein